MRKHLTQGDLIKIKNVTVRKLAEKALKDGEKVPYGVVYIDDRPPTKAEKEYAIKLSRSKRCQKQ